MTPSAGTLTVPGRFNGPPGTGNGGWSAGRLARELGVASATVRLRRPVPLDRPLGVVRRGQGLELHDRDELVAAAVPDRLDLEPAPPVTVAAAAAASASYPTDEEHPYPRCVVCGPARPVGDGLRIFAGPVGDGRVAAVWMPGEEMAAPEFVWAALDCPTGFALEGFGTGVLLGTVTGAVDALPTPGEPHVVVGWEVGREGRKLWSGGALYDAHGQLLARTLLTWVTVRAAAVG